MRQPQRCSKLYILGLKCSEYIHYLKKCCILFLSNRIQQSRIQNGHECGICRSKSWVYMLNLIIWIYNFYLDLKKLNKLQSFLFPFFCERLSTYKHKVKHTQYWWKGGSLYALNHMKLLPFGHSWQTEQHCHLVHPTLKNYTFPAFGLCTQVVHQSFIFPAFQQLQHQRPGDRGSNSDTVT